MTNHPGTAAPGATTLLRAALALGLAAAASCGGDAPVEPRPPCAGRMSIVAEASDERAPRFTWTPDCAVARIEVTVPPTAGATPVYWAVRGGAAGIPSGVRFGVTPRGATVEVPADLPRNIYTSNVSAYFFDAAGVLVGVAPFPYFPPE